MSEERRKRTKLDSDLWPMRKHRGERIIDIAHEDPNYLEWALESLPCSDELTDAVRIALAEVGRDI